MAIARFPRRADGSSESGVAIDAVNAIGPDDLVAQIVVICISDKATDNPNATVEPDDLIAFERRHGRIPERALVCMNSGWANTVNDGGAFGGGGVPRLELSWLLDRYHRLVGDPSRPGWNRLDTMSLDPGNSGTFADRVESLASGRFGIESFASLGRSHRGALSASWSGSLGKMGPKHLGACSPLGE